MTIARTSQQCPDTNSQQFDLFISYNRNDSEGASQLARDLEKRGVRVWLDTLSLVPSDRWQAEIASALARANAVAVLIGPSGLGGWQELELQMALATQPTRGQRIIPVPLPGAARAPTLPALLAPFMHCDLRAEGRTAQVDKLADVLLADRDHSAALTDNDPADWLLRLFQSSGKALARKNPVPRVARAQPEPVGSRKLFSAEDADELLQMLEPSDVPSTIAPASMPAAEDATQEVTQVVPSLRERMSR